MGVLATPLVHDVLWMACIRQSGESRALRPVLRNHAEGYALLCFHLSLYYSLASLACSYLNQHVPVVSDYEHASLLTHHDYGSGSASVNCSLSAFSQAKIMSHSQALTWPGDEATASPPVLRFEM